MTKSGQRVEEKIYNYLRAIDKSSPIPIYHQIKHVILEMISFMNDGDMIPSLPELASYFKVATPTVRQAIQELVADGELVSQRGQGTFVKKKKIAQNYLYAFKSFRSEMENKGLAYRTVVLDFKTMERDTYVAPKLHIEEGEKMIILRRLRFVDNQPLFLLIDYLPEKTMKPLFDHELENESLGNLIEEILQTPILFSDRSIEIGIADEGQSNLLKILEGSPLLNIETLDYVDSEIPIHYSIANYRGDRSKFSFRIQKEDNSPF